MSGNFSVKLKQNELNKNEKTEKNEKNDNNNKIKGNKNKANKKKMEKKEVKKEENDNNCLWIEVSEDIKKIFSKNYFIRLKDLYIQNNILYIFGLKFDKNYFQEK